MNKIAIIILMISTFAFGAPDFDPENVKIEIEHGVEVANQRPGFILSIYKWIPKEEVKIFMIAPDGTRINLDDGAIKADDKGTSIIGIDYKRKGFHKGTWMMLVAGKAGIHQLTIQLPSVTPPSQENENWVLDF